MVRPLIRPLTRRDLARWLHKQHGVPLKGISGARRMVTLVLAALAAALSTGKPVELRGLGSFRPVLRPAREVGPAAPHDPRGRGDYQVEERADVRFYANREVRRRSYARRGR